MEKFYSNPYGALEMTLLWNNNAVFFMHSLLIYEEGNSHKVIDTVIPISYNRNYIKWLCDNRDNLEELFNEGIWYQDRERKKNHHYSELLHYFTDNLSTLLQKSFEKKSYNELVKAEIMRG